MKVTLNTIFIKLDILFDKWNIKAKLDKYNSCSFIHRKIIILYLF